MTRREMMVLLSGLVPFTAGCGVLGQSMTYRYRMTVEVDTPQGIRSASSVIQVYTAAGTGFPGPEAGGISTRVTGEAVAVDLPDGEALFALLTGPRGFGAEGYAVGALLPTLPDGRGHIKAWFHNLEIMKTRTRRTILPPGSYPMLVRFRDTRDPKSVELVDPSDLAASFGADVKLRRITIQITDDRVTDGINTRLPWLYTTVKSYLNGKSYSNSNALPSRLGVGAFKRKRL